MTDNFEKCLSIARKNNHLNGEQKEEFINILCETFNKENPIKATLSERECDDELSEWICPKCKVHLPFIRGSTTNNKFCYNCGQKLKWRKK